MRVITFSPTSPQFVKNTNAAEHRDKLRVVQGIVEHQYVDDYFDSCAETKEAVKIVADVIDIHRQGGFHIMNCRLLGNLPLILPAIILIIFMYDFQFSCLALVSSPHSLFDSRFQIIPLRAVCVSTTVDNWKPLKNRS